MTEQQEGASPMGSAASALRDFASTEATVATRRVVLTKLIREKVLPKQADSQEAVSGRNHILDAAIDARDQVERLLAIADAVRMSQVVKRWASVINARLALALSSPLPPIQLLNDVDDRLNVARACGVKDAEWIKPYLEAAVASEETGEKARLESLSILLARSTTLEELLTRLADAFATVEIPTEDPGTSVTRRQTRTLTCLRPLLATFELEVGSDIGAAIQAFATRPASRHGKPQNEAAARAFVGEILLFTHELVRTHISLAIDPSAYAGVKSGRKVLGGGAWPPSLKKPLAGLIQTVSQAILLLARQGVADDELKRVLETVCNFPERAMAITTDLANRHPEIPEPVRGWLRTGKLKQVSASNEVAQETTLRSADSSLGVALQGCADLALVLEQLTVVKAEDRDAKSAHASELEKRVIDLVRALIVNVERLGALRGLMLFGEVGQPVDMTPSHFVSIGETASSRPLVVVPAVIRRRTDGTPGEVVVRGAVR